MSNSNRAVSHEASTSEGETTEDESPSNTSPNNNANIRNSTTPATQSQKNSSDGEEEDEYTIIATETLRVANTRDFEDQRCIVYEEDRDNEAQSHYPDEIAIAIFKYQEKYYAINNRCPHQGGTY